MLQQIVLFNGADGGLWATNGTAAGTHELTGISGADSAGLRPSYMTVFDGEVLFNGTDASGTPGLWVTNGTASGTHELTDVSGAYTGGLFWNGFGPYSFTTFNGEVLFGAVDASKYVGLWVTDGTSAGTHELTGISGTNAAGLYPQYMTVYNGEVLFDGYNASGQTGLWVTNGTAAGTYELTGISGVNTGTYGFLPYDLTVFNGKVLFNGTNASGIQGLWVTDGTSAGTHELTGISGAYPGGAFATGFVTIDMTVFNGEVFFRGIDTSENIGLWVSDGTSAGTHELTGISGANSTGSDSLPAGLYPIGMTVFNGELLFEGQNASGNRGLWVSDGTAAGTHELTGISGAYSGGLFRYNSPDFTIFNGQVLFSGAGANNAVGLWVTDGTSAGTHELSPNLNPSDLTLVSLFVPPSAPSITSVTDDVAPVAGVLTNGATTNDPDLTVKVSLSGTGAAAGDTVQLYNGTGTGSQLGSSYTLTNTDISNSFANVQTGTLADGTTYTFTVRITDAAGNQSAVSTDSFTVTEDTTAPTVAITSNGGLTNHVTHTVYGTVDVADAGTTVIVLDGANQIGTTTVQPDGSWATDVTLSGDGVHTLNATDTDAAGNVGTSNSIVYTLDTVGPQVQSFTSTDPSLTTANVVHYALTFSEPVTGVNASEFSLVTTGVNEASIASVMPVGGSNSEQYTVTVNTGTGDGTIALDLSGAGIQDLAGNPLPGGTFQAQTTYYATGFETGFFPMTVAIGDFNGDGKPDLVVAGQAANGSLGSIGKVLVLFGNGDGTFSAQTAFVAGAQPQSSVIGDLNGDGKPDLVFADRSSNIVLALLGNGDGTFQTQTTYATGMGPLSVAIGDLNGDGKPDLVVANPVSNNVSALLGNGDGTFQTQTTNATGSYPASVAIGDLNGDGKLDLLVANAFSNTVSVLLGNGNGTFQTQITYATGSNPLSVAIGDLNGDGRPDLAVANTGAQTVSVLLGNGDGTFQMQTTYATRISPYSVAIGDLNGDGRLDLVVANESSNNVSVLFGNGDGTLQMQTTYATGIAPYSVAIGDLNGDGRLDLAFANESSSTVSVLLNNAPTFVGPTYTIDREPDFGTTGSWLIAGAGDFNHDGTSDVLLRNTSTGEVDSWLMQNGQMVSSDAIGVLTGGWQLAGVGDFNHDLVSDILLRNTNTGEVDTWIVQNGQWSASGAVGVLRDGWQFAGVGDFSHDGVSDVLLRNANTGEVDTWIVKNGQWSASGAVGVLTGPWQFLGTGDFNGDGTSDVLLRNADTNEVDAWLVQNGQWAASTAAGMLSGNFQFAGTGDFNHDGTDDILLHNSSTGEVVAWLLQNGSSTGSVSFGTFETASQAVAIGDFNHDGKSDVLWQNPSTSHVVEWLTK